MSGYHVTLSAWGYVIALRSDSERAIAEVLARLPANFQRIGEAQPDADFLMVTRATRHAQVGTYRNGQFISEFYQPVGEDLWDEAERSINLEVASFCPDHVFVHAGVVAYQGGCVVIPGRSRSGKSELTRALIEQGAHYFSDEYAVLDRAGLVHPYARALSQRRDFRRVRTPAVQLGWTPDRNPLPIAAVVTTHFVEGQRWKPTPSSRGQSVWAMFHNTVSATISPELALQVLPESVKLCSHCYEGPRGEAGDSARRILKEVFGSSRAPSTPVNPS